MPTKRERTAVSLYKDDIREIEKAMENARVLEGVAYTSAGEFVRDAVRRRIRQLHEELKRPVLRS